MQFLTKNNLETQALGEKIGEMLIGGEVILLEGDLGGGKTQFTKGLAKGIGVKDEVTSPTFTIERIYKGKNLELHHFDFYRLNNDQEIKQEIDDLLKENNNIIVIEWPQNIDLKITNPIIIKFKYIDDDRREINIDGNEKNLEKL